MLLIYAHHQILSSNLICLWRYIEFSVYCTATKALTLFVSEDKNCLRPPAFQEDFIYIGIFHLKRLDIRKRIHHCGWWQVTIADGNNTPSEIKSEMESWITFENRKCYQKKIIQVINKYYHRINSIRLWYKLLVFCETNENKFRFFKKKSSKIYQSHLWQNHKQNKYFFCVFHCKL